MREVDDGAGLGASELPAVRRALGELPYSGAMLGYDGLRLVEWLARYGGIVQGEAERAAANEAALSELRRDVAGLRRVLGVGSGS